MRHPLIKWLLCYGLCCLAFPVSAAEAPLKVVASFSILANLVEEVGGDQVQVTSLVGPNGDAHVYEPTASDAKQVAGAQLLFANGLGFEHWLHGLTNAAAFKGKLIVVSDGIQPRKMGDQAHAGDDPNETDPHAWHDPANVTRYVQAIERALAAERPSHTAAFAQRAQQFQQRLQTLDQTFRSRLAALPLEKRSLITSHDAFGYLAQAYQLRIRAPQGISTEQEPSAKEFAQLADQIRQQGIRALFVENISNPALLTQLARETGVKVGGTLYSDALSEPGTPAAGFLNLFEYNTRTIADALLAN